MLILFLDFVNKMELCCAITDLLQRDDFIKPLWHSGPLYVDSGFYLPNIFHLLPDLVEGLYGFLIIICLIFSKIILIYYLAC